MVNLAGSYYTFIPATGVVKCANTQADISYYLKKEAANGFEAQAFSLQEKPMPTSYTTLIARLPKLNKQLKSWVKNSDKVQAKIDAIKAIKIAVDAKDKSTEELLGIIISNKTAIKQNTSIFSSRFFKLGHKGNESTSEGLLEKLQSAIKNVQ